MSSGQHNGTNHASPHFGLVIDNIDKEAEHSFPVLDPITGSTVHLAPAATQQQAIEAVESAHNAFESWREATPIKRRQIFNKAVEILQARQDELVNAMVAETGAKRSWAAFNISTGIQFVMEGAAMVTQVKGELLQSNDEGSVCSMICFLPCPHVSSRDHCTSLQRTVWCRSGHRALECTHHPGHKSLHYSACLWQYMCAEGIGGQRLHSVSISRLLSESRTA
jgi:hypothetical protein